MNPSVWCLSIDEYDSYFKLYRYHYKFRDSQRVFMSQLFGKTLKHNKRQSTRDQVAKNTDNGYTSKTQWLATGCSRVP